MFVCRIVVTGVTANCLYKLFFTYWKLAFFHDKVIKIKSLEKNAENSSLRSSYLPSARFGPSERFALSTVPELFREVPKRSVPSRADAVRGLPFVSI
jgi:hypothetical protein